MTEAAHYSPVKKKKTSPELTPSSAALAPVIGHEITEEVEHLGLKFESLDAPALLLSECQTQVMLSAPAGVSPPCITGKNKGRNSYGC